MSSRTEQKRQLREQRIAGERAAAASEASRRRLILLGAVVVAALAAVAVLIAVSQSGGGDNQGLAGGKSIAGAGQVRRLFSGIPQNGATLGRPNAPVTMVEFVDMQCPFCAQYSRQTLPTILARYVRTGKVKLEMRPIAILGPDSATAAAAAAAAGGNNRIWQFADLIYLNQGEEKSGYVTDDYLRGIARGAGVDPAAALSASKRPSAVPLLRQAASEAQRHGIASTPSFLLGRSGGTLRPLQVSSLGADEFSSAIDKAFEG